MSAKPADNFAGLLCDTCGNPDNRWNKLLACFMSETNITAPKADVLVPSAIFLIADGSSSVRRGFILVCERVPLGLPESPLIVGIVDFVSVQTW